MDIILDLGGPSAVARLVGCKPSSVIEWRTRGIPPDRCAVIERATDGRVSCEQMRPDVRWGRLPDAAWPWHPEGRPLLDVSAPANPPAEAANAAA